MSDAVRVIESITMADLLLACGEMTAQERRTARAVLKLVAHKVREGSPPPAVEGGWRFKRGAYVRKVVGSKWNGRVVGFYTTELTQRGYAVESMYEIGSVQIYPEKALELFSVAPTPPAGEKS